MIIQDVISGIISQLEQLGLNIAIYDEEVPQNLLEPAFLIMDLPSGQTRGTGQRYIRSLSFNVHYFPSPDNPAKKMDCRTVAERLYDQLEYIKAGNMFIRGYNIRHEIVDGVLHFFISYDIHLMKSKPEYTKMQHLLQEVHFSE